MELRELDMRSTPLMSESQGRAGALGSLDNPDRHEITVGHPTCWDGGCVVLSAVGALLLGVCILYILVQTWTLETNYRVWLLMMLVYPLGLMYKRVWLSVVRVYKHRNFVRIEVDSMRAPTLFNAVADQIENVAESNSATCSSDAEACTQYDKAEGRTRVRMRFWGGPNRSVNIKLSDCQSHRDMVVHYKRGDDIVCGRDHTVQSREILILELPASRDRLVDKQLVGKWLHECVERYREPTQGVVEVFALDQTSSDWVPEWKLRCVRPIKHTGHAGLRFFLKRDSTTELLADALTWCGKELRIYLITGPPGVGKTELTIWLAGFLNVPLYRLSLNDPRLTDQVFSQLVSPTSLRHDDVVLQIDEFQETLERWKHTSDDATVSMGGFCEVLQGSNSLSRGFIILSGTQQLANAMKDPGFAAVFRRIAVTTTLDWLPAKDIQTFFCKFLMHVLPGCPDDDLQRGSQSFVQGSGPWGSTGGAGITIDMLKQFLMLRISSFRAAVLPESIVGPNVPFHVPIECHARFLAHVCDHEAAHTFRSAYPAVAVIGGASQEQ